MKIYKRILSFLSILLIILTQITAVSAEEAFPSSDIKITHQKLLKDLTQKIINDPFL
jgi:hypothetical protein